jgi:hypothetical protein
LITLAFLEEGLLARGPNEKKWRPTLLKMVLGLKSKNGEEEASRVPDRYMRR